MTTTRTLFFRGLAGSIYSTGMDELASINPNWSSHSYSSWKSVAKSLSGTVTLVGHSLGARSVLKMAGYLKSRGVRVRKIICLDYVHNIGGKNDLKAPRGIPTYHFRSRDRRAVALHGAREIDLSHLSHVEMDNDKSVQKQIISLIN